MGEAAEAAGVGADEGIGSVARLAEAVGTAHHGQSGACDVAGAGADHGQTGGVDVGGVVEEGGPLLHFLHPAKEFQGVHEAGNGNSLVVLVADHVLHALHLFDRLLHFLLTLLAAHGHCELYDGQGGIVTVHALEASVLVQVLVWVV